MKQVDQLVNRLRTNIIPDPPVQYTATGQPKSKEEYTQEWNRYKQFLEDIFPERYPEYDPNDGKIHVLYISPYYSGSGLYRAILPTLHLNQTDTHRAIVTNVEDFDHEKSLDEMSVNIQGRLIEWADYIVLPTVYSRAGDLIADIKSGAHKPHLQIMIDLDDNYHDIPTHHPNFERFPKDLQDKLLHTISRCDVLTVTNEVLGGFYREELDKRYPGSFCDVAILPNLMSEICYEDLKPVTPKSSEKVRIGMVLNPSQYLDVQVVAPAIKRIQEKYGDKVEFVCFGWDGNAEENGKEINAFHGLKVKIKDPVPVGQYFKRLQSMKFDFALMPLATDPESQYNFNIMKSNHKFLQYAKAGVPVIMSEIPTYQDVTKTRTGRDTCLVAQSDDDWYKHMETLINDPDLRAQFVKWSQQVVSQDWTLNEITVAYWQNLFTDPKEVAGQMIHA